MFSDFLESGHGAHPAWTPRTELPILYEPTPEDAGARVFVAKAGLCPFMDRRRAKALGKWMKVLYLQSELVITTLPIGLPSVPE